MSKKLTAAEVNAREWPTGTTLKRIPMPDFVSADEARKLLDGAHFNEEAGEGIASLSTNGIYAIIGEQESVDIIYYDGGEEDVTGLGDYIPTGGTICTEVPADFAELFIASPDLASTVIAQAEQIKRLQNAISELGEWLGNFPLIPLLVGTGTVEDRAFEMRDKAVKAINQILEEQE